MERKRVIHFALLICGLGAIYIGYLFSNFLSADERELGKSDGNAQATGSHPPAQSNIVVIVLDDADAAMFSDALLRAHFPNIRRIASEGIRFDNCHVTTPVCAPSRASFFRGQYAHNTGVCVNDPAAPFSNGFSGSYSEYTNRSLEKDDLSVWLQSLGYRTMLVGKYLHNNFDFKVPAGWQDFYCSLGNRYFQTARFTTSPDANRCCIELGEDQYRTRVEANDAVRLIQQASQDARPFFLYVAPMAPHDADVPDRRVEPRYASWWPQLQQTPTPDFNERDIQDKSLFADVPPLTTVQIDAAQRLFRDRMLSVKSVDDMVGQILATLEATHELGNTYIVFTSDHGFLTGQHRLFGKCLPYTRATNVPLFVRGPGIAAGQVANHLIAHIDVAPTLVELAGGAAPAFVDGKSFVALLRSPKSHPESTWREPILIGSWESARHAAGPIVRPFSALRSFSELYVQWSDGGSEYYDLLLDPWELENQIATLEPAKQLCFAKAMRHIEQANSPPTAAVVAPEYKVPARIAADSEINGYAADDNAIERVDLVIQNADSLRYWNGVRWQNESVHVAASLDRPGGMLTGWRYDLRMRRDQLQPVERIAVTASATDSDGNQSTTRKPQSIEVDWRCPETLITTPINNGTFEREARFNGKAWDNVKPISVRLTLRDIPNQKYWDGSHWTSAENSVTLHVSKMGRWHYILPLHASRYGVWINAVDAVGNVDPTPATAVFNVK